MFMKSVFGVNECMSDVLSMRGVYFVCIFGFMSGVCERVFLVFLSA